MCINYPLLMASLLCLLLSDRATAENKPHTFVDCQECPEMVQVAAGQFAFGSPEDEPERVADEGPQTEVAIQSFAISKFEITRGQFLQFVTQTGYQPTDICFHTDETGRWNPRLGATWEAPGFSQTADHPVVCVSWPDAKAYVAWLNDRAGDSRYRLLNESEWEYVARGGSTSPFWWGATADGFCAQTNGADRRGAKAYPMWDRAGDCDDGFVYTAPVGQYNNPNVFGASDLVGNVWEWVADCYADSLSTTSSTPTQPSDCEKRVFRGGAWDYSPLYLRTAYRGAWQPDHGFTNLGFRVAKSLD